MRLEIPERPRSEKIEYNGFEISVVLQMLVYAIDFHLNVCPRFFRACCDE